MNIYIKTYNGQYEKGVLSDPRYQMIFIAINE